MPQFKAKCDYELCSDINKTSRVTAACFHCVLPGGTTERMRIRRVTNTTAFPGCRVP